MDKYSVTYSEPHSMSFECKFSLAGSVESGKVVMGKHEAHCKNDKLVKKMLLIESFVL